MFTVTNSSGNAFTVRVVLTGDSYGRDKCLTHDDPKPVVEFYDATYIGDNRFEPEGQFVSSYYYTTLADDRRSTEQGLNLQGDVPKWRLDDSAFRLAMAYAKGYIDGHTYG
jgi:hypothetical protein